MSKAHLRPHAAQVGRLRCGLVLLQHRNDRRFRAPIALHRPVQRAPAAGRASGNRTRLKYLEKLY
jgi:hypothetical protein